MHLEAAALATANSRSARVLVIGAGPVGLTLAHELAHAGIDVMVLERGPMSEPPLSDDAIAEIKEHLAFRGVYPSSYFEVVGIGGKQPDLAHQDPGRRPTRPDGTAR